MTNPNTVTGTVELKFNLIADFTGNPSPIDTDIVAKFTKSMNSGTIKNLKVTHGKFTPANNEVTVDTYDIVNDNPKFVAIFVDKKVGLECVFSTAGDAATHLTPSFQLIDDFIMFRVADRKTGKLKYIRLLGGTAQFDDPTDVEQGAEVNYTIISWEET